MRILITGDKGFVGTETKKYIKSFITVAAEGVFYYDGNKEKPTHEIIGYDLMDGFDIRDIKQFEQVVINTKPDRILHLAAIARFAEADKDPKLAHETNVLGTMNVASIAGKYHIPLVYASTGSVYMPISEEPPIKETFKACGNSVYGCTTFMGEEYIRSYCNPYIILRYAHLYGKEKRYHGLIGGFLSRIERGLAPKLYGGKQSNDFTYIKDVAKANVLALTAQWDSWNQIYNVGTGEELTAQKAGDIVCRFANYNGTIDTEVQREVDPSRFVYDVSKAENMLGFKAAFSFEEGLKDMFKEETHD